MFICVCLCPSWLLCCTCASPEIVSCVALGHTVFFVKRQVVQLVSSVCSWARGLGCHDSSLVSVEVEKPPPVGPSGILTFPAGDGYVLSWFWCVRVLLCRLPVQLVTRFVQKGLEFTNSECPLCRLKAYLGMFGCLHHTCNRTLFPFCGCFLVCISGSARLEWWPCGSEATLGWLARVHIVQEVSWRWSRPSCLL